MNQFQPELGHGLGVRTSHRLFSGESEAATHDV